jgi:hypothetical protein
MALFMAWVQSGSVRYDAVLLSHPSRINRAEEGAPAGAKAPDYFATLCGTTEVVPCYKASKTEFFRSLFLIRQDRV